MAQRHLMPQSPMTGTDNRPRTEWQKYLAGIEDIGERLDDIDDLAGGATLPDVVAKINEILAAFRTG
jgi:hypothetical protein